MSGGAPSPPLMIEDPSRPPSGPVGRRGEPFGELLPVFSCSSFSLIPASTFFFFFNLVLYNAVTSSFHPFFNSHIKFQYDGFKW